jgi:uncharacterized membrane protein (DUF4010 family)
MDSATVQLLLDACIAIGLGLFIGLEREHDTSERQPKSPEPVPENLLGVRTFALLGLFGWVAALLGGALPVAALVIVGALVLFVAFRFHQPGRGLTTEAAALTTFLLGMLVHQHRLLAVALGIATTLLLISKPWFQTIIPKMKRVDLTSTLQLVVLLAIVLPLLPAEARDPWHVLSPRKIGVFVALIAAIGYVGYVLNRLLGTQRGAGLTGLVGGLASSTAVTAAMAQQSKANEAMLIPGQLGTFLASAMMCARVLVVALVIDSRVALALAGPIGAMAAVTLAGAFWRWRAITKGRAEKDKKETTLELTNPFSLLPVLKWGLLYAAILVASALGKQWLGTAGLYLTAVVSGLMDVDAINLTASNQAKAGEISAATAALAVMIAVGANTVVKSGIAWTGGGKAFGAPVSIVFGASAIAGLAVAFVIGG